MSLSRSIRYTLLSVTASTAALALATVAQAQDVGTHVLLTGRVGTHTLKARLAPEAVAPRPGETAWLRVLGRHTCFYRDDALVA